MQKKNPQKQQKKKLPEESFRSWKGNADADVKTDAAVMKLSRMAARSFRLADTSAIMSREAGLKNIPLSINSAPEDG